MKVDGRVYVLEEPLEVEVSSLKTNLSQVNYRMDEVTAMLKQLVVATQNQPRTTVSATSCEGGAAMDGGASFGDGGLPANGGDATSGQSVAGTGGLEMSRHGANGAEFADPRV